MNITDILNLAVPALITTVLVPFIASAITALTEYIKTKTKNATLDKYLDRANDAVVTAVAEVMQTFVTTLKNSGEWNAENAQKALEMAKLRATEIMGTAALKTLPEIVGDFEKWLTAKVEAATIAAKAEFPPAAALTGGFNHGV